jgi:hypothetical protein
MGRCAISCVLAMHRTPEIISRRHTEAMRCIRAVCAFAIANQVWSVEQQRQGLAMKLGLPANWEYSSLPPSEGGALLLLHRSFHSAFQSLAKKKDLRPLAVSPSAKRRCERQDLNLHPLRDWILSPARLPIPPLSQSVTAKRLWAFLPFPKVGTLRGSVPKFLGNSLGLLCCVRFQIVPFGRPEVPMPHDTLKVKGRHPSIPRAFPSHSPLCHRSRSRSFHDSGSWPRRTMSCCDISECFRRCPRICAAAPAVTRWECHHHPTHSPR